MQRAPWLVILRRSTSCPWMILGLLAALALPGCGHEAKSSVTSVSEPPTVRLTQPEVRSIVRVVGQPSFVESYERTSIYPKLSAFIEKWYVDIGDRVRKNQVLADLFVPEIEEDYKTKGATVELDKQRIELALKTVKVAEADVKAAAARLDAAKAILEQYQSQVDRWKSEVKRLTRETKNGVVDRQVLDESQNQLRASAAARDAAKADILKAEADLESKQATEKEDEVAVDVARADLEVAISDWKRMEAWVGYLKLYAPYDGVVVARNANTGDFVLPATGDPTTDHRAPYLSPDAQAAPVYVVQRTDVVRIFVDIPEQDANYVRAGTKATVLIRAFRDKLIPATVTRTSWALNVKSRTLRAEIDLHNTDAPEVYHDPGEHQIVENNVGPGIQILPGMYAYGKVIIERPNVRALPVSALAHTGEKTFYWSYDAGHAVRTEVQTGVSDGTWVEVTNHQLPPAPEAQDPWAPIDGSEQVIVGDLSILTEGIPVQLARESGAASIATANPLEPEKGGLTNAQAKRGESNPLSRTTHSHAASQSLERGRPLMGNAASVP
ncbi:MAG TPA: efflux RND transporter periplasmic adaptor subunit [Planctomycetaceae bacterium]|nr:efflux RND transporter periplasmic adaptor subunit [Planctomycetaceae bacterium]